MCGALKGLLARTGPHPRLFLRILYVLGIVRVVSPRRIVASVLKLLQFRIFLGACLLSRSLFLCFCRRCSLRRVSGGRPCILRIRDLGY